MSFLDDDAPEAPITAAAADGSVWAVARAAHAEAAAKQQARKPLELDIPGSENAIVVRFKFVELGATEKTASNIAKLRSMTDQALYAAIDTLVLACDELLVRTGEGLVALASPGEPPVRFDHRLCAGMGWEKMPARRIVHKLYGGVKGEYAMLEAAQDVSRWMQSTDEAAAEDFAAG